MSGEHTLVTEAVLENLGEVRQFVEGEARSHGVDSTAITDLVLAVDEAVTNIVVHGYKHQPGSLEVSIEDHPTSLFVHLRDEAPPFDPCAHRVSDLAETLEKDTPGGFGLHLIYKSVDEVSYQTPRAGGNELTLVKHKAIPPQ